MAVHLTANYLVFKLKALLRPFGHILQHLWALVILFSEGFLSFFWNSKQADSSQNLNENLIRIQRKICLCAIAIEQIKNYTVGSSSSGARVALRRHFPSPSVAVMVFLALLEVQLSHPWLDLSLPVSQLAC